MPGGISGKEDLDANVDGVMNVGEIPIANFAVNLYGDGDGDNNDGDGYDAGNGDDDGACHGAGDGGYNGRGANEMSHDHGNGHGRDDARAGALMKREVQGATNWKRGG